jgi:type IV fimbrial biogenesis protein FimT
MEKYRFLRRSSRGFTLIEMMVTVALMVILGTMAAPALQSYVTRSGMQTLQNDFTFTLKRARSEAVSRNTCVSMCQLKPGTTDTCETANGSNGHWESGWIMFELPTCDSPTSTDFKPTTVIQVRQPGNTRFQLVDRAASNRDYFTFNSRGVLRGQTASLDLYDSKDLLGPYGRAMSLSAQGRLIVEQADANAIATAAGGTAQ